MVNTKEQEILAFKDYQSRLEVELREQKRWSEEMEDRVEQKENDLVGLTRDLKLKEKDVNDLTETVLTRQAEIREFKSYQNKLEADVQALTESLKGAISTNEELLAAGAVKEAELQAEQARLWAIIEDYRLRIERSEASISWRIAASMRATALAIRSMPGLLWRGFKDLSKHLVYKLPADNMFRQRILRTIERVQSVFHHDVDNRSIREAHKELIADRWEVLGEKPLLIDDDLPEIDLSIVTYNLSLIHI